MKANCKSETIKGLLGIFLIAIHLVIFELTKDSSQDTKNIFVFTGVISTILFFALIKPYIYNCVPKE